MESKVSCENQNELLEKAFAQAVASSQLDSILVEEKEYTDLKQDIKHFVLTKGDHYDGRRAL